MMAPPNPRKISLFLENLSAGGEEQILSRLASNFAEEDFIVDLILIKAEGPFLKNISPSVNIVDFNLSSPYLSFLKLIAYLRREKPNAMISTMELSNLIFLICKKLSGVDTKSIIRTANTVSRHHRVLYKKWIEKVMLRMIYPWADTIIAVSYGVAGDLSRYANLPLESIRTIYNPVINSELIQKSKEPISHPWFTSNMPPVLLAVGRLTKQKNYPRLIRAFSKVLGEINANLLILGAGNEKKKLMEIISNLGIEENVQLAGFVQNPYAYMANASVFVLSSDWEGLPTVLIEAMACGCPVVATNCPSGPDEILDGGKYGHLVPLNDVDALAKAILNSLSSDSRPVNQKWLDQFGFQRGFESHLEIIEE